MRDRPHHHACPQPLPGGVLWVTVGLDAIGVARVSQALCHATPWVGLVGMRRAERWDQAWELTAGSRVQLAVFDPFVAGRSQSGTAAFAAAHPGVQLIAYARLGAESAAPLLELLRSGVHGFVTRDVDDTPVGFLHHLQRARLGTPSASAPPLQHRH